MNFLCTDVVFEITWRTFVAHVPYSNENKFSGRLLSNHSTISRISCMFSLIALKCHLSDTRYTSFNQRFSKTWKSFLRILCTSPISLTRQITSKIGGPSKILIVHHSQLKLQFSSWCLLFKILLIFNNWSQFSRIFKYNFVG